MKNKISNNNLKTVAWISGVVIVLLLIWNIFTPVYRPVASSNIVGILITGLVTGAIIMFLIWKLTTASSKKVVTENSHTIVESIRKVFKIVCAEGHFNELYNFEETKNIFGFIPSTKRALVIIEAKVLVGFDFEKCQWEMDETNHTVKLLSFPEPQILSIEPDYKYCDDNCNQRNDDTVEKCRLVDRQCFAKNSPLVRAIKYRLCQTRFHAAA